MEVGNRLFLTLKKLNETRIRSFLISLSLKEIRNDWFLTSISIIGIRNGPKPVSKKF